MKILTISTDRKIFEEGSAVSARQIKYGSLFERLDIIVFARSGLVPVEKKLSENTKAYSTNSISRFLYFLDALRIGMRLDKPDLVSAQDPFESGVAAFLISKFWGVPMHLQVHTDFLSPYFYNETFLNKIRLYLAKFLIKRAGAVRVVTDRIKQSIVNAGLLGASKISVLPIFVDTEKIKNYEVRTDLHKIYPQFDFIILMASRLTSEKNIPLAIEAMRGVIEKYPKTGLVIVGDGPEKDHLKLLTTNYSLQTNIAFENWSNDLSSYYKTADLFLLTSNYEGYGLTVMEALSAGLPVVMSDVGCAGELLIHKKNGLVFPVGDIQSLTSSLISVVGDNTLLSELKKNTTTLVSYKNEGEYLERYKKDLSAV